MIWEVTYMHVSIRSLRVSWLSIEVIVRRMGCMHRQYCDSDKYSHAYTIPNMVAHANGHAYTGTHPLQKVLICAF